MNKKRLLITLGIGFMFFFLIWRVVTLPFEAKLELMFILFIVCGVTVASLFTVWLGNIVYTGLYGMEEG